MSEVRGHLMLVVVAVLGLIGGVWTLIAPFVTGFPFSASGGWTRSIISTVVVGGVVSLVSAILFVVQLGQTVSAGVAAKAAAAAAEGGA